jgi:hypothetical protein
MADIGRMKSSLLVDSGSAAARKEKRELLRNRSQDRIQNWPNTLDALRKKKEDFVKDREEKLEAERRELDRQEAELRRQVRLDTIGKANDMMFRQSDKMKMLKSQMAYADAVHHRQFQIAEKQVAKQKELEEEAYFHRIKMEAVVKGEAEEKAKVDGRKELVERIKVTRKEQLDEVFARRQREKDEAEAIGAAMKRRAAEQIQEDLDAFDAKQKHIAKSNKELMLANEKFIAIRKVAAGREKIEEAERKAEVEEIDYRKQARKDLANKRFLQKQEQRQKIIDVAVELLAAKANTEEAVQQKQAADKEAQTLAVAAAKEAKRADSWKKIVASRTEMVERNLDNYYKEKESEKKMSANWRQLTIDADNKRIETENKRKEETRKIKAMQKAEAVAAARKKVADKLAEQEQSKLLTQGSDAEENKFINECRAQIEKYASEGKPVYTLLRALEMRQAPLLPAIKNKRAPKSPRDE